MSQKTKSAVKQLKNSFSVIALNVNGIISPVKRQRLAALIKHLMTPFYRLETDFITKGRNGLKVKELKRCSWQEVIKDGQPF